YPPRPVTAVRTRPLFTNAHSAAVACQWSSRMTHRGQPHGDPGDSLGDRQLLDGGFIRIALAAHAPFDFSRANLKVRSSLPDRSGSGTLFMKLGSPATRVSSCGLETTAHACVRGLASDRR